MSKISFSISTIYEVTTQMFEDVIADITYSGLSWCYEIIKNDKGGYDFTEEETDEVYNLTLEKFADAVYKIVSHEVQVNHEIRDNITVWAMDYDASSEFDFECADVLVQVALFGEIVYG